MDIADKMKGLTLAQAFAKRSFDLIGAGFGLVATFWIILPAWALASLDTRKNGFFTQERVGRGGRIFRVIKIRTMREVLGMDSTVTTGTDQRITRLGRFWRRAKIDELPQLINVVKGEMSFVGPRPDVPGYADKLTGDDRIILTVRPGVTGPATLKYRNEEEILAQQPDPERYNDEVIFPDKVRINREYIQNYCFAKDIKYIIQTVLG